VAEAALFYHPAVWWVSAQIRAERESCCDDLAVEATGDLLAYASALTNLDSHRRSRMRLATTADGGSLVSRIRRLLGQPEPPSHALPSPAAVLALSLLWLAGMGAVLAHGANSPAEAGLPMVRRPFIPPAAAAASTPLPLPTPPSIRSARRTSLTAALLFDPFLAPLPQTPPADDPKKPATVSGTVLSTSGTPIAGASAVLDPVRTGRAPAAAPQPTRQVAISDATGKFTFANVPPGTYQFSVSHQVYLNPRNLRTEAFGPLPPSRLTLTADQHIDDLAIKLVEPATLTGRTVDEDGDPVARADVQLIRRVYSEGRRRLEVVASSSSGDNGEFKISGLPPGRYLLKADKGLLWAPNPAYMGYFGSRPPRTNDIPQAPIPAAKPGARIYNPGATYYGGSNTDAGATPIDISPGQNIPLGVIKMGNRVIVHVRGKVVGDLGLLADARVAQLSPDDIMLDYGSGDAGIGKDGSFDLPNIRPANQVTIAARNKQGGILAWTRITVGPEDVQGVILNASAAPMNGTVRFEGDETPPNASSAPVQVYIASAGTPLFVNYQAIFNRQMNVNADGSFTIPNVPPGLYTIGVGLPEGSYLKSARLNGIDLPDQRMEWRGPGSGALELTASRKAAVIEGAVLDEDGKPARGTVTLVPDPPRPAQGSWYPSTTADAQGSFRFPSVTPGRYKLYSWEEIENTAHWDADYIRPFESSGQSVEVQEGGHATVTVKRISAPAMRDALRKAGIL
jgi:protocatechuate 3,4-dioxygenase beta subunit